MKYKISQILVLFFITSFYSYSQTFKPNIGLTDRLMNSYLLCDRSVSASEDAWYGEHDSAAYNIQYDIMLSCSKFANRLALNNVLAGKLNCTKAEQVLFTNSLTCQNAIDEKNLRLTTECRTSFIKICEDYLYEKNIHLKKLKQNTLHF